jgi:uncharacterized repeat protein (TIGR01451 family)
VTATEAERPDPPGTTPETPPPDEGADDDAGPAGEGAATAADPVLERTERDTARWKGVTVLSLVAGGVGLYARIPALLLASVVPLGYLAYVRATESPEVALTVERVFGTDRPDPGDEVTVRVTVTNAGDRTLPDLRLVDAVPESLPVVDGSARAATALRPGEAVTLEYAVRAKRGDHVFDRCIAVARDLSGTTELEVHVATDDRIVSTPSTDPTREVPLRALTSPYTGRVETDDGGEGVEFHATREYRPGDSLSRIDWNRHARTGELSTVEFRQERSATVVLVLDLRKQAYLREDDEGLHAADRGVEAASQVFTALLETGDRVGIAAFAPEEVWLAPGTGNEHWARARNLFATHPALSPTRTEARASVNLRVRQLRQRLSSDAQVILFSPLCDDPIVHGARLLDAHGHLVTVVSPDPTADGTPGQQLARAERATRMAKLRSVGVRVIDWAPDEHLAAAIDRAGRRWSG